MDPLVVEWGCGTINYACLGIEQGVIFATLDFHPSAPGLSPRALSVEGLPTRQAMLAAARFVSLHLQRKTMTTDESKRRRRGPVPLDAADKRVHSVSVRLNDAELARLETQRGKVQMQRGEYLRAAALHRLPRSIPELNREAWASLARSAANLNQIAHRMNAGDVVPVVEVRVILDAFRRELLGVRNEEHESES